MRKLPPVWDLALVVLTVLTFGYLILNYERIAQNGGRINQFELIIAVWPWCWPLRLPAGPLAIWPSGRSSWPTTGLASICR